jgi:PAS domain-containing protein
MSNARVRAAASHDRRAARETPAQGAGAILDHIDVAVVVRAGDGSFVYANQAAAELLGLPDREAVGTQSSDALMARFDVYDEAGAPLALGQAPRQPAAGR